MFVPYLTHPTFLFSYRIIEKIHGLIPILKRDYDLDMFTILILRIVFFGTPFTEKKNH